MEKMVGIKFVWNGTGRKL